MPDTDARLGRIENHLVSVADALKGLTAAVNDLHLDRAARGDPETVRRLEREVAALTASDGRKDTTIKSLRVDVDALKAHTVARGVKWSAATWIALSVGGLVLSSIGAGLMALLKN